MLEAVEPLEYRAQLANKGIKESRVNEALLTTMWETKETMLREVPMEIPEMLETRVSRDSRVLPVLAVTTVWSVLPESMASPESRELQETRAGLEIRVGLVMQERLVSVPMLPRVSRELLEPRGKLEPRVTLVLQVTLQTVSINPSVRC